MILSRDEFLATHKTHNFLTMTIYAISGLFKIEADTSRYYPGVVDLQK